MLKPQQEGPTPILTDLDRQREKMTVEIRKQHREEIIAKKRVLIPPQSNGIDTEDLLPQQPRSELDEQLLPFYRRVVTIDNLFDLISKLNSSQILQVYEGMIGIRQLLAKHRSNIQNVIELNTLPKIMSLAIQKQHPKLRVQAAWALANVAAGDHEQCQVLVNRGGIPLFIELLKSDDEGLVEQSVWAVSNIASDCVQNRDSLLVGGALQSIIKVINTSNNEALKSCAAWALSNLCRGIFCLDNSAVPAPNSALTKDATPYIARVVADPNCEIETLIDCCWALYHLSQSQANMKKIVATPGLCGRLAEIIGYPQDQLVMPIIRIMGNILSSTAAIYIGQEQIAVELAREDILTPFEKLLSHIKKVIRKEVCWCLSNLSACSFSEVQLLINKESLIRKLLDLLTHNETEIQLEIVWIFRNLATVHQPIMYAFMRTYRVVRYIVSLLVSTLEPRLQEAALSALKMLLKLGEQFQENGSNALLIELKQLGVLPKIEDLQLSDTTAVYELALSILEEFCETVDPLNR